MKMGFATIVAGAALLAQTAHADEVRVAWYGGNWGEAFDACIAEPFTKATGITVIPEIGTSTTSLAKMRQQASRPVLDVVFLDGGISEVAQAEGLLSDLDSSALPNMAAMQEQAVYRVNGQPFAVSVGYYSLGIAYDTREVQSAPDSWEALWDKQYAGAVILPSSANSSGIPFLVFLGQQFGGTPENMSSVWNKLKQLDVASYYDSSGAASNAFQAGEAVIGAHFNVGAWDLADKGLPIGFAVPKEGVWATDARVHQVKNAPNPQAAQQFINAAMTPESAACLAEKLYLGPAVKGVELPEALQQRMPWGQGGSVATLNLSDWTAVNQARAEMTDTWNRELGRR